MDAATKEYFYKPNTNSCSAHI